MRRFQPRYSTVLVLAFLVTLGAELWCLRLVRGQADRARAALQQKITERNWLEQQSPALDAANEQAIATELVQAAQALTELRAAFRAGETAGPRMPSPGTSIEGFFDLANFVEKTRAAMTQAKVSFAADERFGFTSYANEGPAPETLPAVYRQRLLAEQLLEKLREARPLAFLGLERESVTKVASVSKDVGDFFVLDPGLTLRRPGQLETTAFRLEFSGQTATLRNFLNELAEFPQPLLVRGVDVRPLAAASTDAATTEDAAVPLVRQNFSKFAVIVEYVSPGTGPSRLIP